jgi:ATP-dependent DNA ligase
MEAQSVESLPPGDEWQYEPKWDGFRCLAFREGSKIELQSKSDQPLARYFPELVAALERLEPKRRPDLPEMLLTGQVAGLEGRKSMAAAEAQSDC